MKRDMDLVREILLAIEASNAPWGSDQPRIEGRAGGEVGYHLTLMMDAGLIGGQDVTHMGSEGKEYMSLHLTWMGHEFLDAAKPTGRWDQAKAAVDKVGAVSFATWVQLLTKIAAQNLGLDV